MTLTEQLRQRLDDEGFWWDFGSGFDSSSNTLVKLRGDGIPVIRNVYIREYRDRFSIENLTPEMVVAVVKLFSGRKEE